MPYKPAVKVQPQGMPLPRTMGKINNRAAVAKSRAKAKGDKMC